MWNGKEVTVRRKWTKSNKVSPVHEAVKEYLDNSMDDIRTARNIPAVYNDFVEKNPDNKCSYSTLYAYYQSVFNTRKARKAQEVCSSSESEHEVEVQVWTRTEASFIFDRKKSIGCRLPPFSAKNSTGP